MSQQLNVGPFCFSSTGVRVTGRPEMGAWQGPLQFAIWCQRAGPWWIGDLVNAGEDGFGEAFSQMCEGIVSDEALSRYASVARRVPIQNRRPALSWSTHAIVARLAHVDQKRMLADAEKFGWASDELRAKVREFQQSQRKP